VSFSLPASSCPAEAARVHGYHPKPPCVGFPPRILWLFPPAKLVDWRMLQYAPLCQYLLVKETQVSSGL